MHFSTNSFAFFRETEVNSRHLGGIAGADSSKPIPSPKFNACFNLAEMYVEPVDDEVSSNNVFCKGLAGLAFWTRIDSKAKEEKLVFFYGRRS